MSSAPTGPTSMGAAAAPRARSLSRGGGLLATLARSILPIVCALAPATPAAAVGQLPSQVLPQPAPLADGGDLEEASYLRLGLLQTGAGLSGSVDAEGCEGQEEGPYVQAGLLQRSAQLTEAANASWRAGTLEDKARLLQRGAQLTEAVNASRRAGALEDKADAGKTAMSDAPWMMIGLRLLTVEGTLRRSEGNTALTVLIATFLSLLACCLVGCGLNLQKEGPEDRHAMSASRRPAGDLGGRQSPAHVARAAAQPAAAPGISGRSTQRPATPLPPGRTPEQEVAEPPGAAELLLPPVLCPTLVLPNMDTCFRISMESLQAARPGAFDIKGASGRALLGVSVRSPNGKLQLQIGPVGREDEPRAVVMADPTNAGQLKVYGRDGALFATLEPSGGHNKRALVHDGEVKMMVMTELGLDLQFQAFAADGRLLADAGRSGQEWAVRVRPKVDAILVTACMLAMVYFGPSSSGRASAAPGQRSPLPVASRSPSAPASSPGHGGRHP